MVNTEHKIIDFFEYEDLRDTHIYFFRTENYEIRFNSLYPRMEYAVSIQYIEDEYKEETNEDENKNNVENINFFYRIYNDNDNFGKLYYELMDIYENNKTININKFIETIKTKYTYVKHFNELRN